MPDVTRMSSSCRLLRFAIAAFALALPALGQEPTPTPTPTPAPTAHPVPAGSEIYAFAGVPSTGLAIGAYDGSNLIKDSGGAIWAVSASDNSISRMSADRTKL